MMKEIPELLKLEPFFLEKIWGGRRLAQLKGGGDRQIGETWEISTHPDGPSKHNGQKLLDLGHDLLDLYFGPKKDLSFLVKLIETTQHLSIQVHPPDDFAKVVENSLGKDECWLVLEAQPGAGVFLGFKKGVGKDEFAQAIKNKADLSAFLNFYELKPGDFVYLPAGTVHSIGKGLVLLEVQQNSGLTYRVWDWNRTDDQGKPRQLHIEKALQVLQFDSSEAGSESYLIKKNCLQEKGFYPIHFHSSFNIEGLALDIGAKWSLDLNKKNIRGLGVFCLQGGGKIKRGETIIALKEYESMFVPIHGKPILEWEGTERSHWIVIT